MILSARRRNTRRVASLDRCRGMLFMQLRASSWSLDSAMCTVLSSTTINERMVHIYRYTHIHTCHVHMPECPLFPSVSLAHYYIFLYLHLRLVYFTRFYVRVAQMQSVPVFSCQVNVQKSFCVSQIDVWIPSELSDFKCISLHRSQMSHILRLIFSHLSMFIVAYIKYLHLLQFFSIMRYLYKLVLQCNAFAVQSL